LTHVGGQLSTSSALGGTHAIDLVLCSREIVTGLEGTARGRSGLRGTVDGVEVTDFVEGFDPDCRSTAP
jgi:hypothetical protein